jgi:hypothetical protein
VDYQSPSTIDKKRHDFSMAPEEKVKFPPALAGGNFLWKERALAETFSYTFSDQAIVRLKPTSAK